jgi:hypothetical protein
MKETIDGYTESFPNGVRLKHSKYWHIPIWGLVGAVLGGLAGAGLDFAGDKTDMYGKRRREDKGHEQNYGSGYDGYQY